MTAQEPANKEVKFARSPFLEQLKQVHQYQGRSNDCGPFCAAEAIHLARQKKIAGTEMGRRMGGTVWRGIFPRIRRIRNWATFPWGVRDVIKEENIQAQWKLFQKPEALQALLQEKVLLIVIVGRFFPSWAHYKILAAHDPQRGYGFIDSAYKTGDLHWESADQFEKYWKNYGSQVICVHPDTRVTPTAPSGRRKRR